MHIDQPQQELVDAQNTRNNLETFIKQPVPSELPPCPGCKNHIKTRCTYDCPDAAHALSSQPDDFPIERNTVPLVFGLMSTRVTQTCWSCEGHMDTNNKLIKLPTVSFYTSSPVYSQLLHRHLKKLEMDKKLTYPWLVILTDYAQTWAQTYSVVPDLNFIQDDVRLGALQQDLKVIGDDLQVKLKILAADMIVEIDHWLNQTQHA